MSKTLFMNEVYYQHAFGSLKNSSKKRSPRIVLTIIIILLLSGFLVYVGSNISGIRKTKVSETKISPSPTEFVFPTESSSASQSSIDDSITTEITKTPTVPPTINPVDKTTGLNRSKLSVAVQNGSGETGAASKVSEVLKEFGYKIVSIGNADSFTYENMAIEVKKEKSSYLPLLKKDLGITYTIGSTSADLSASASADALVIIGK